MRYPQNVKEKESDAGTMESNMEKLQKFFNAILLLLCLVLCAALFKGYLDGEFHSVETLQR